MRFKVFLENWVNTKQFFPNVATPLFHVTNGPRAGGILWREKGIISGAYSNFGSPQVGISLTRNLTWALKGDFGRYIFVIDRKSLPRNKLQSTSYSRTDDEFEERYYGTKIPLNLIKGLIYDGDMSSMEKKELKEDQDSGELPFPIVHKGKHGWETI